MSDKIDAKVITLPTQEPHESEPSSDEADVIALDGHRPILTRQNKKFIARVVLPIALAGALLAGYNSYQQEPVTTQVGCIDGNPMATELGKGNILSMRAQELLEGLNGDTAIVSALGEVATEGLVNPANILAVQDGIRNEDGSVVANPNSPEADDKFLDPAICVTTTSPRGNPEQVELGIVAMPNAPGR